MTVGEDEVWVNEISLILNFTNPLREGTLS